VTSSRPSADAIVVGAGIVGASCALALANDGWRVTIVDAEFPAAGTTSVGMGHVVVMDDSPEQLALTAYSARLWAELAPRLDARAERDVCGTLWVAEDEAQLAALYSKRAIYQRAGVATEVLDARDVANAEPNLRRGLTGALRVPGDNVVYPPGATLCLLAMAAERGASIRPGTRVRRIVDNGIECDTGTLRAPVVVNAAGAHAASLTPQLPIVPRKGHLAITDRYPGFIRHQLVELGYLTSAHVMTTESVAFNLQPRTTGQVLIGSSRELVEWNASLNHDILRRMLRRATQFVPSLGNLSIIRCWTGFRPATPDKLPLIGRWDPVEGLYIAAGHEGLGITTSLATGRLLADEVAGRPSAIDRTPFAPTRVLAASASREAHA
jgi:glycine/D-amino acid oxidase-like deaminating enzyme